MGRMELFRFGGPCSVIVGFSTVGMPTKTHSRGFLLEKGPSLNDVPLTGKHQWCYIEMVKRVAPERLIAPRVLLLGIAIPEETRGRPIPRTGRIICCKHKRYITLVSESCLLEEDKDNIENLPKYLLIK
jgi:hypothetical protein